MIIKKTVEFDSAHMLSSHKGGCQNLHGHTYKMIVGIRGENKELIGSGSSEGMLMDFKDLKNIMKDFVSQMDHAFIYNCSNSFQSALAQMLEKEGKKTFLMDRETTVENMSQRFMFELKKKIPNIHSIEIWETPTSSCYIEASEVEL